MMSFEEFAGRLEKDVKAFMNGENVTVKRKDVELNGSPRKLLVVNWSGSGNGISVDLEMLYSKLLPNADYMKVAFKVITKVHSFMTYGEKLKTDFMKDYSQVKIMLNVEVINAERNKMKLAQITHTDMMDMAFIYGVEMDVGEGTAKIRIKDELLRKWGISKQQLHDDAMANTARMHPLELEELENMIARTLGMEDVIFPKSKNNVYVATNSEYKAGAVTVFYPMVMDMICESVRGDCIVIPSSVHEMLIMPDDGNRTMEEIRNMLAEANAKNVPEGEVLSDNIFRYSRERHSFEMIDEGGAGDKS
ncbi:MAG: DUF5688 family protein [Eubacteriales bacterium]|nr:DUF5688 family protein [Eubacteriales bacterium]